MTKEFKPIQINETDYHEILLRAVAVIDNARNMMAQNVCSIATNSYWGIGKFCMSRNLKANTEMI